MICKIDAAFLSTILENEFRHSLKKKGSPFLPISHT